MENRVIYKKRFPKEELNFIDEEKAWWQSYNKKLKEIPGRVWQGEMVIEKTIEYSKKEKVDADIIFVNGLISTTFYFRIGFLNRQGMLNLFEIAQIYDDIRFYNYNAGAYEVAIELCFRTHKK